VKRLGIGIVCHPAYGGSGVVASELGLALASRGHQVHFVSHELPFRVPASHPNTSFHKVEVTSYPLFKYPPYTQALASRLFEISSREDLDIVHVHYAIPHSIAAYLSRQMLGSSRPRIVTTLHGTDITLVGLDESFHAITRFGINQSDAVTAVSKYLADETRARFSPEREVLVVPNFVDSEVFSPGLRDPEIRRRYAAPGEKIIGHLSNFRSVKRVGDVVRTFHLIQKKIDARLLMVGAGAELEPARHLAAELGLSHDVRFLGPVTDIAEVLAQLDLFLLTSEYESFGLAALEAMACGVPVVCSRAGGIPEVVEDGVSGLLCSVGDYRCMAAASIALLSDEARHRAMSEAARRRAVEAYPPERAIERYEEIYRSLLGS
jgi:N-acetyl-alpha-D-glucosaminyl L-malate synthase BshA